MTPETRWSREEEMLAELREALPYPATPDLRASVRAGIAGERPRAFAGRARFAAVAAMLVAAVALALAIALPGPREALADFFGLAVRGERIETLPTQPPGSSATPVPTVTFDDIARPSSLQEAAAALGFEPVLAGGAPPDRVYVSRFAGIEAVVLRYPGFDVWQFVADGPAIGKGIYLGAGTVEPLLVEGEQGYWITGGPRLVTLLDAAGREIAGTTRTTSSAALVWNRGNLYLRVEGDLTRGQALTIAAGLR